MKAALLVVVSKTVAAVYVGLGAGLDAGVPGLDAGLVDAVQAASVPVKVREVELSHVLLAEPVKEV